jgi:hypothetical protein
MEDEKTLKNGFLRNLAEAMVKDITGDYSYKTVGIFSSNSEYENYLPRFKVLVEEGLAKRALDKQDKIMPEVLIGNLSETYSFNLGYFLEREKLPVRIN